MSYFKETEFDINFRDSLKHLIKNRQLIKIIKEDIKARAAATALYSKQWRQYHQAMRAFISGKAPMQEFPAGWDSNPNITNPALMRHIYLAYTWLRGKPFWATEPNTRQPRNEYFKFNQRAFFNSPTPEAVAHVIDYYAKQLENQAVA